MITVYVPRDSAARSVGADEVAQAITHEAARRQLPLHLVRNGSWGMFWLEPLVEVATPAGRIAYGPVSAADVPGLSIRPTSSWVARTLCGRASRPTSPILKIRNA